MQTEYKNSSKIPSRRGVRTYPTRNFDGRFRLGGDRYDSDHLTNIEESHLSEERWDSRGIITKGMMFLIDQFCYKPKAIEKPAIEITPMTRSEQAYLDAKQLQQHRQKKKRLTVFFIIVVLFFVLPMIFGSSHHPR